jgi:diguanylate cyclase (GGDEF)-like protein
VAVAVLVRRAGAEGVAALDLFGVLGLFAFHFYRPAVAGRYLVAACTLFGSLSWVGSYPYATARLLGFTMVMLSSAVLIAKVRSATARFIAENWQHSQTDSLTGLANVRSMRFNIDEQIKRAGATHQELALMAIDLDGFKSVNDAYSHSTGDALLVAVARAIAENVRDTDVVARRGGDEFVVILPDADAEQVRMLVERIAAAVSRARQRVTPDLATTATIAAVQWKSGQDASSLLKQADTALHEIRAERGYVGRSSLRA